MLFIFVITKLIMDFMNDIQEELKNEFRAVNFIWNKFGFDFIIRNIDFSLIEEKQKFEYICNETELMGWFYSHYTFPDNKTIIIFTNERTCENMGEGIHFGSNQTILITKHQDNNNFTWTIIHELGHRLGLLDKALYSGEINLMTHDGCIKYTYPTNLNKKQVEIILNNKRE